jgi:phage terminase large subunit
VFIGTPKGRNGFFELWRRAQSEAGWFSLMLKASETGLIPASELELARRDLTEEQYAQEFECSFDAAVVGSYYGKLMMRAEMEKRIAGVPYDPAALVWTSWDLGIRDATAIWFAQVVGREIRIIDYYEASGVDLGHYVREIHSRPYVYAGHIVPHDEANGSIVQQNQAFVVCCARLMAQIFTAFGIGLRLLVAGMSDDAWHRIW